jgi:hypothetical protein
MHRRRNLEGMKDVVRKKLDLATSVPIYFSQLRNSRSVDLADGYVLISRPRRWLRFATEMHYLYPPLFNFFFLHR